MVCLRARFRFPDKNLYYWELSRFSPIHTAEILGKCKHIFHFKTPMVCWQREVQISVSKTCLKISLPPLSPNPKQIKQEFTSGCSLGPTSQVVNCLNNTVVVPAYPLWCIDVCFNSWAYQDNFLPVFLFGINLYM